MDQSCGQRGNARFFTNRDCPYFPCHEGVDPADFNCLFCYCPLYALGSACGGDFAYTADGVKDCSGCARMHEGVAGAALVDAAWPEIDALTRKNGNAPRY